MADLEYRLMNDPKRIEWLKLKPLRISLMIQKQELEKDKTAINDEKIKQLDIQINEVNQKMDELETYLIDAGLLIPYIPVDLYEFE